MSRVLHKNFRRKIVFDKIFPDNLIVLSDMLETLTINKTV